MKKEVKNTLFLDRDGVINVQLVGDYVKDISEFVIRDDFLASLPILVKKFRRIIVVTNQQGIAKGVCTREQVDKVHRHLLDFLEKLGVHIDGVYVCPHLAGSGCNCRKPEIGMALQAKNDFPDIDFADSVMIGDSATDMIFGRRSGMETVFIGKITDANCTEIRENSNHIVNSILEYAKTL